MNMFPKLTWSQSPSKKPEDYIIFSVFFTDFFFALSVRFLLLYFFAPVFGGVHFHSNDKDIKVLCMDRMKYNIFKMDVFFAYFEGDVNKTDRCALQVVYKEGRKENCYKYIMN